MISKINAKKGAHVPRHHHEAEQIFLVFEGEMRVTNGRDSTQVLAPLEGRILRIKIPE